MAATIEGNKEMANLQKINLEDNNEREEFHCHYFLSKNKEHSKTWKKLVSTGILCFIFMIIELIGGLLANSLSIMTDSAHLFSDLIGFGISLISLFYTRKSPTPTMTFGYHRAEVLGALFNILILWMLAFIFSILAIHRVWREEFEIEPNTMLVTASFGVVVNIIMGVVLHGLCTDNHDHTHFGVIKNDENINIKAASAHILADLLQSLGVLIAAIIVKIFPNAKYADPVCTLIFSVFIVFTTRSIAKHTFLLLLEGASYNDGGLVSGESLASELRENLANVKHVHSLHIWCLSPGRNAFSVHLCIDDTVLCDRDTLLKNAYELIESKLSGLYSCTIQIECYTSVHSSCTDCQNLYC